MKNPGFTVLAAVLLMTAGSLVAQEKGAGLTDLILSSYSSRSFNSDPVSEDQIDLVLRSGIKSPSARNSQPWHFTVIKDDSLAKEIIRDVLPGNVLIVISGPETVQEGMNVDIDCSLATAYMYLAAQSLGLASHLYTGPVREANENLKEKLELPDGYRAVLVMRMGNSDNYVDGVSSASPRNDLEKMVTYKLP